MLREDEYYTLKSRKMSNWIVKTPSDKHAYLPANEYSCMKLTEAIDIEIPEVKLVPAKDNECEVT